MTSGFACERLYPVGQNALLSMAHKLYESELSDALAPAPERGAPATPVALTRKRKYTSIFLLYSPHLCRPPSAQLSISGHNSVPPNIICAERLVRFRDTLGCRADGGRVYFAYWTIVHMSRTILSRVA